MNETITHMLQKKHNLCFFFSFWSDMLDSHEFALFGGLCFPMHLIQNCMIALQTWHVSQNVAVLLYSYKFAVWNLRALGDIWNKFNSFQTEEDIKTRISIFSFWLLQSTDSNSNNAICLQVYEEKSLTKMSYAFIQSTICIIKHQQKEQIVEKLLQYMGILVQISV